MTMQKVLTESQTEVDADVDVNKDNSKKFVPRLIKPHPAVQKTTFCIEGCDRHGHPSQNDPNGIETRVSKRMFKSALVVMDRLIKALDRHGIRVNVFTDYEGRGTFASEGHDRVRLAITEEYKRVEHVPTDEELKEKERYSWHRIPKWDYISSGCLILSPGGVVDLSSDEAINQLVEKAVQDVVEGIAAARLERERRQAAQQQEWRRQRQAEDERKRIDAVVKAAEALRVYRNLIDYIAEVRRFGRVPADQFQEGQTLEQWLAWAERQARRIHPLGKS